MINETMHLFTAGAGVYLLKSFLGHYIEKFTINYLGTRKGFYA